uniref:Nodal modulator 1 n=1 Tax=Dracunculus medinensis TaxID=318479 RepID=A0A158Q644_DRAME
LPSKLLGNIYSCEGYVKSDEPSNVHVKVDGISDPCTRGEDINFKLVAFAIEGILRNSDGDGPAGVSLVLLSENGLIMAETKTTANGAYQFRAPPGKYLVSTADDSECIERNKVSTEVISSPVRVSPDLKISGQLLSVEILSNNEPFADADVALYSNIMIQLPYCREKKKSEPTESTEKNFICSMRTNTNGLARFPCLPPGKYSVVPSFITNKVRFTFLPKLHKIIIESAAEKIIFNVLGFSSRGRVLIGLKPVADAEIFVNHKMKTTSDQNGWYIIEDLQNGNHSITAKKERYLFHEINVDLNTGNAEIPDIMVKSVEICAIIKLEDIFKVNVVIQNQKTKLNEAVLTTDKGKVCSMLPPGNYIVSVTGENGLVIVPKQREISTFGGPTPEIIFTQFKANIHVKVKCKGKCLDLVVELWKDDNKIRTVVGNEQFLFDRIIPDSYKLKIVDNGIYCWEQSIIDVTIERSDLNDLYFVQTGHLATIDLSHPAKLEWRSLVYAISEDINLPKGISILCLPEAGAYSVVLKACHIFDQLKYELIVPQKLPLVAKAEKSRISTKIITNDSTTKSDHFFLKVKTSVQEQTIKVSSYSSGEFDFVYHLPISDSGTVSLTPTSDIYLFNPESYIFEFSGECHDTTVSFVAIRGVFLEGQIHPPLEDVDIRLVHKVDPDFVRKAKTNSKGQFRIGPLQSLDNVNIVAAKDGYKFEKTKDFGILKAKKLSHLQVFATDIESKVPLGNVLLSLSGVENYRSNNILDDTGKITFVGLHAGEYFLRPILQEYQFEPATTAVVVSEEETVVVELKGHRFAYSVYGKISYLGGQPVASIVVEAVSEQCSQLQEEDMTSEKGEYRIRGLRPNCFYRLVLKSTDRQRLQSYPTHCDVSVTNDDIKNIDFALTHISRPVDIIGSIEFVGSTSPSQFKIGLYKDGSMIQHTVVHAPSFVFFFQVPSIDYAVFGFFSFFII